MKRAFYVLGMSVLLAAVSGDALAAGKAGLWSVTQNMAGVGQAPAMPNIPPEQLAKMKALGIQMPNMAGRGGGFATTSQVCITPQMAANNTPPRAQGGGQDCKTQNVRMNGRTMTADIVCTGAEMQGKGTYEVTYDSDTHYSGKMNMNGVMGGQQRNISMDMEGTWQSANCGNVAP